MKTNPARRDGVPRTTAAAVAFPSLYSPESAAQLLLHRFSRVIPFRAAAITDSPAEDAPHRVFVNNGYDNTVANIIAHHVEDESFDVFRQAAGTPLFWRDLLTGGPTAAVVSRVLRPAGYREGSSIVLSAEGGRVVAALHLSFDRKDIGPSVARRMEEMAMLCREAVEDQHRREAIRLSPRERQILALVARGDSNAEIATELALSRRTVATHLEHIFDKLETRTRVSAAVSAMKLGLV